MTNKSKIKIAVSSCLLGNNVRYDGNSRLDQYILDRFGSFVDWVPVCPEAESGMPVPREPMQLVGDAAKPRLITINTKIDRTEELTRWIGIKLQELEQAGICGFILKARSPSCSVHDAEFFSSESGSLGRRAGLFAEAITIRFPALPVEDEEALRDREILEKFIKRIRGEYWNQTP